MGKPGARSILYRLIEAGQLTRKALLVPLVERGLEPGDDAVLFLLHQKLGATEAALGEALGIDGEQLQDRINRLAERNLIERRAIGADLTPGLALTDRGERMRDTLTDSWAQLEEALLGELPKKQRKHLRKNLGRFTELLKL